MSTFLIGLFCGVAITLVIGFVLFWYWMYQMILGRRS